MEILVTVIMVGMLIYEFVTGEVIVKNGARGRAVSRKDSPGTFWFVVALQVAIMGWMTLELLGVVNIVR